jgi:hypothetical protein
LGFWSDLHGLLIHFGVGVSQQPSTSPQMTVIVGGHKPAQKTEKWQISWFFHA